MNSEKHSEEQRQVIPAGYAVIPAHSGLGKHLGPFYIKNKETVGDEFYIKNKETVGDDGVTRLGVKIEDQHGGGPGRGHGGMTMSLLDEAMGRSASLAMEKLCVTITMNTNFCSGVLMGDFLIAQASVSHRTRKTVFLEASVHAGDTLVATSSGVWKNSGLPIPGGFPD